MSKSFERVKSPDNQNKSLDGLITRKTEVQALFTDFNMTENKKRNKSESIDSANIEDDN